MKLVKDTLHMKLFIENTINFDEEYTEEYLNQLIDATYEVAPKVYRKYNWDERYMYSVDDYTQDAVMEIIRLFNTRYINLPDPTKKLTNLVYTLLDKFFTFNTYKKLKAGKHANNLYLSGNEDSNVDGGVYGTTEIDQSMIASAELTPEDHENIKYGKAVMREIVKETLVDKPIRGRTHDYAGHYDGKDIYLSDRNIGYLIVDGLSPNDVIEVYGMDPADNTSAPSLVRKRYRLVTQQISKAIAEAKPSDIELVSIYLDSIVR